MPARAVTPAAVLVPLVLGGGPSRTSCFTLRRGPAPPRGEISFPGGRRDAEDPGLVVTALREAEEEIGLPRTEANVSASCPPTSTFATGYRSTRSWPIPAGPRGTVPREVDAVLEIPLGDCGTGRDTDRPPRVHLRDPAYLVEEHLIWGATARIIDHLLERLRDGGTAGGPASLG